MIHLGRGSSIRHGKGICDKYWQGGEGQGDGNTHGQVQGQKSYIWAGGVVLDWDRGVVMKICRGRSD